MNERCTNYKESEENRAERREAMLYMASRFAFVVGVICCERFLQHPED